MHQPVLLYIVGARPVQPSLEPLTNSNRLPLLLRGRVTDSSASCTRFMLRRQRCAAALISAVAHGMGWRARGVSGSVLLVGYDEIKKVFANVTDLQ